MKPSVALARGAARGLRKPAEAAILIGPRVDRVAAASVASPAYAVFSRITCRLTGICPVGLLAAGLVGHATAVARSGRTILANRAVATKQIFRGTAPRLARTTTGLAA